MQKAGLGDKLTNNRTGASEVGVGKTEGAVKKNSVTEPVLGESVREKLDSGHTLTSITRYSPTPTTKTALVEDGISLLSS